MVFPRVNQSSKSSIGPSMQVLAMRETRGATKVSHQSQIQVLSFMLISTIRIRSDPNGAVYKTFEDILRLFLLCNSVVYLCFLPCDLFFPFTGETGRTGVRGKETHKLFMSATCLSISRLCGEPQIVLGLGTKIRTQSPRVYEHI